MNFSDETVSKVGVAVVEKLALISRNVPLEDLCDPLAQAALSSLTLADLMPWQPIETAPKDGRTVLVFYKNSLGKDRIIRVAYTQKFTEESDNDWAEYSEEKDCYYSPEGWYEQMEHWDEYGSCFVGADGVARFSHWMPLPNPPTEAK